MSRTPSAPHVVIATFALFLAGLGAAVIGIDDSSAQALETSVAGVNIASSGAGSGAPDPASVRSVSLPTAGAAAQAAPLAPTAAAGAAESEEAEDSGSDSGSDNNSGGGHDHSDHNHSHDNDPTKANGYDVHNFIDHVDELLGTQMMAPAQGRTAGYTRIDDYRIEGKSPITGLRPVVEQAITDVIQKSPNAQGQELERKVAKRLTELNDWKNLNSNTREKMMLLSGVDIQAMDKQLREDTVNHLLHSPMPFGNIDEVLSPDVEIDLGYTHTLDKNWTQVAHLGDGVFQIWMVSNNNNGSHTGHTLGSFKVQLTPDTSLGQAKQVGNEMLKNKNNNNKLYLDEAARKILYGETPWLDFGPLNADEKRAAYVGRPLGSGPVVAPLDPAAPAPDPEAGEGDGTPPDETTTTTTPVPAEDQESTTTTTTDAGDPSTTETSEETTTTVADSGSGDESTTTTTSAPAPAPGDGS